MDFYKRLSLVGEHIPYGKVATYGQLALLCGKPQNSRQVGYALRSNKVANFPAHRLLNGKGVLSGAAAFATPDLQRKLLASEGILVDADNKVDLKKFQWHHSYDDALEFCDLFERLGV